MSEIPARIDFLRHGPREGARLKVGPISRPANGRRPIEAGRLISAGRANVFRRTSG